MLLFLSAAACSGPDPDDADLSIVRVTSTPTPANNLVDDTGDIRIRTGGDASTVVPPTPTPSPTPSPNATPIPTSTVTQGPTPTLLSTPFTWPGWARTARIAGASFHLEDSDEDIDDALDRLASQQVSVVLADSPWGWSYVAWMDDSVSDAVQDLVSRVVEKAHPRGLKVVMYQTGLELTSAPGPRPSDQPEDWLQQGIDGNAVFFNDIGKDQEHWLDLGEWDLWLSPCSGYRELSQRRVREMASTGLDGLWVDTVYLQHSIGAHEDLWPSTDSCSTAAFKKETGMETPTAEDWDDPVWRRWIVWRHSQVADFLLSLKAAAREINPDLVFFEENWNIDSSGATLYTDQSDHEDPKTNSNECMVDLPKTPVAIGNGLN